MNEEEATGIHGWNHRVVLKDGCLAIHEVMVDKEGEIITLTVEPVQPLVREDEGVEALKEVLSWMLEACNQPIVDYDTIDSKITE